MSYRDTPSSVLKILGQCTSFCVSMQNAVVLIQEEMLGTEVSRLPHHRASQPTAAAPANMLTELVPGDFPSSLGYLRRLALAVSDLLDELLGDMVQTAPHPRVVHTHPQTPDHR